MIDESYLSQVHSISNEDEQKTFGEYVETEFESLGTTIAVVSEPTGGIRDVCDEFEPALGMPKQFLNDLREVRAELSEGDDVSNHNKAVEKTNLEEKYRDYLKKNEEVEEILEKICSRVKNGEKITFVCFEKEPKWCHRHILVEVINEKLESY